MRGRKWRRGGGLNFVTMSKNRRLTKLGGGTGNTCSVLCKDRITWCKEHLNLGRKIDGATPQAQIRPRGQPTAQSSRTNFSRSNAVPRSFFLSVSPREDEQMGTSGSRIHHRAGPFCCKAWREEELTEVEAPRRPAIYWRRSIDRITSSVLLVVNWSIRSATQWIPRVTCDQSQ